MIPANIDLSAAEVHLVNEVAREQILARVLRRVAADYDVILIDCQPSLGLLTVNALTASHGVLIPLECEYFALRGVALLIETIDKVRDRLNPAIELDGILATMYDSRTLHSREVLERVVDAFGDKVLETVIDRTVKFPDATVAATPDHRVRARAPGVEGRTGSSRGSWSSVARSPEAGRPQRPGVAAREPAATAPPTARHARRRLPRRADELRGPVRPAALAHRQARARHHRGLAVARSPTSSSPTCAASTPTRSSTRRASSSWSPRPCST